MNFDGALIKEQGVSFAIIVVKPLILNSSSEIAKARKFFSTYFSGIPIVLMAQDNSGIPTFQGRSDIVDFLSNISIARIPWKTYSIN